MRVIGRKENNAELREFLLGCDWALKDIQTTKRTCKMCLNRPYVLLMEYIPAIGSTQITSERAEHIFQIPKDNLNYFQDLSKKEIARLQRQHSEIESAISTVKVELTSEKLDSQSNLTMTSNFSMGTVDVEGLEGRHATEVKLDIDREET